MGAVASGKGKMQPANTVEKRQWVYAKKPQGKLYRYRQWIGYTLLLFLFAAPFAKINGNPLLMFNIIERKFSIIGYLFYPQDLYIFVFGMLIMMVCIVLFTVVYGRVWCGWTCPQTIFMELLFRPIEYLIEGDWQAQRKLNEGPDSDARALKKIGKHSIFLLLSFFIANTFLAYIIGIDHLYQIVRDPVDEHLVGFIAIIVFTLIFYAVFAHIREIVCTTICPYGRLQSVLLDDQSLTVAYDVNRGEPRGKAKRESSNSGDCVDCKLCVHVCPTGIDIRNGLQMECISCTACIDACDAVMRKLNKPERLIGFYSMGEMQDKPAFKKKNTRAISYTAVLVVLVSVFVVLLCNRSVIDGRLLRATGSSYQLRSDGLVSNLYTLELRNKAGRDMQFEIAAANDGFQLTRVNNVERLKKDGTASLSFFLLTDKKQVKAYKQDVKINILAEGEIIEQLKTTFIAPVN